MDAQLKTAVQARNRGGEGSLPFIGNRFKLKTSGKVSGMTPKGVLFYAVLPTQSWKYTIFVPNPFLKGLCQQLEYLTISARHSEGNRIL
ncbi:hypothetical protein LBYZC6_04570 [Lacrimispora brassicae]